MYRQQTVQSISFGQLPVDRPDNGAYETYPTCCQVADVSGFDILKSKSCNGWHLFQRCMEIISNLQSKSISVILEYPNSCSYCFSLQSVAFRRRKECSRAVKRTVSHASVNQTPLKAWASRITSLFNVKKCRYLTLGNEHWPRNTRRRNSGKLKSRRKLK